MSELPPEKNPERVAEKVSPLSVKKEKGYLYFVDKDGDVARVPAKWNDDPEFLKKEKLQAPILPQEVETMPAPEPTPAPVNIPAPVHEFEDPLPATEPGIPAHFIDRLIFYHDKAVIEIVGDNSLSQSHLKIYPKLAGLSNELLDEEFIHNATIASFSASILFEALKAQGTNIIFNEVDGTLQTSVIPRFENDGLNLFWDIKQGDPNDIAAVAESIKSKLVIGEIRDTTKINLDSEPHAIPTKEPPRKVNMIDDGEPVNYMLEHLKRDF